MAMALPSPALVLRDDPMTGRKVSPQCWDGQHGNSCKAGPDVCQCMCHDWRRLRRAARESKKAKRGGR